MKKDWINLTGVFGVVAAGMPFVASADTAVVDYTKTNLSPLPIKPNTTSTRTSHQKKNAAVGWLV